MFCAFMSPFKLHRRATVRAERARQCAIKFHIAAARIAAQFAVLGFRFGCRRVGTDFLRLRFLTPLPEAFEHGVEVLLVQFAFRPSFDLPDVSAIRTLHDLFADMEFQIRAAGCARKDSAFAAVKGPAHLARADIPAEGCPADHQNQPD